MAFEIKYNKARFPIQQKREDGKWGCRGCGGEIPKGRESWCSRDCYSLFCPQMVIIAVKKRDGEVCACGYDYRATYKEWYAARFNSPLTSYEKRKAFPHPKKIEYDHIIPFSEGGLTVIENMRSLCSECHKERTRKWHSERKQRKNQEELFKP